MLRLSWGVTGQRLGGWLEWKIDTFVKTSRRDKKLCVGWGAREEAVKSHAFVCGCGSCGGLLQRKPPAPLYVHKGRFEREVMREYRGGGWGEGLSRIFYLYSTFVRKNNVYSEMVDYRSVGGWGEGGLRNEDSCSGRNRDETTLKREWWWWKGTELPQLSTLFGRKVAWRLRGVDPLPYMALCCSRFSVAFLACCQVRVLGRLARFAFTISPFIPFGFLGSKWGREVSHLLVLSRLSPLCETLPCHELLLCLPV